MADVIDLRDPEGRMAAERDRVVRGLRALADRLEQAPAAKLRQALPIAAWSLAEFERQITPWLRSSSDMK
jgi:hypothetical protein